MKTLKRNWLVFGLGLAGAACLVALNVLADVPPVLTITPLGGSQYAIVITNGVATNNYELHWTPALADANYPWTLTAVGDPGETNWSIDVGSWPSGYFRVSIEQFYNGVPDYQLADLNNPSLGSLTITIDSPANGSNLN